MDDVLIVAGDVSDSLSELAWCLRTLRQRFRDVRFVPGNHEFWVTRSSASIDSLLKFEEVVRVANECGASSAPVRIGSLSIVPLLGWYDLSFGTPTAELIRIWGDFVACRWPPGWTSDDIAAHFDELNESIPSDECRAETVISFSHFMPRLDLLPVALPSEGKMLGPVLGSTRLERWLRLLGAKVHVYGHSHINRDVVRDGVRYVNNALGNPREGLLSARRLKCVHEE